MPALLFTEENPFKLFKILKKNQSKAPIKAGQKAPNDIIVPAGATSFSPGPIIGDLGALKIKTGIENGKVAIKEDAVVAKEGEVISQNLAAILQRLGIEPMTIGLDLIVVYQDGEFIGKEILDVDEEAYKNNMKKAVSDSLALALEIGYVSKDTVEQILQKAFRDAKALALEQNILTDLTRDDLLAKADMQARALQQKTQ
jgi:large subunit ribosomal protein L10